MKFKSVLFFIFMVLESAFMSIIEHQEYIHEDLIVVHLENKNGNLQI